MLIIEGYFDPKAYFPSINLTSLDDTTFDDKIKGNAINNHERDA